VAELLAMISVMSNSAAERLLRPTESAVRRLIVIAARGLVVKPFVKRPMPKGLVIARKGGEKPLRFPLFDRRPYFDFIKTEDPYVTYVKTYESNPFNPFSSFYQSRPRDRVRSPKATLLARRLAAVADALENLPKQAQRMARWKARRKTIVKPKFTSPLRPGPPPGHRSKPTAEIDYVLKDCHGLAWDVINDDSS
jgi:hypothetical protein